MIITIYNSGEISFAFAENFYLSLQCALGVSEKGLRLYPLNLMQLVLPKGKVRPSPWPCYDLFYRTFLSAPIKTGMEIIINQQQQSIPDNSSVQQLLSFLMPGADNGIAVAINHQIIPKSAWATHKLNSDDNVMLIRATQGG